MPLEGGYARQVVPGITRYHGNLHSDGGIMRDPNSEVEDGETEVMVNTPNGPTPYIMSTYINMDGTKNYNPNKTSVADMSVQIAQNGGTQEDMNALAKFQEMQAGRDGSKVVASAKHGGPLQYKSRGLWDNIHAKRRRIKAGSGEKMRNPGSTGAPTNQAFKRSQNMYGGVLKYQDTGAIKNPYYFNPNFMNVQDTIYGRGATYDSASRSFLADLLNKDAYGEIPENNQTRVFDSNKNEWIFKALNPRTTERKMGGPVQYQTDGQIENYMEDFDLSKRKTTNILKNFPNMDFENDTILSVNNPNIRAQNAIIQMNAIKAGIDMPFTGQYRKGDTLYRQYPKTKYQTEGVVKDTQTYSASEDQYPSFAPDMNMFDQINIAEMSDDDIDLYAMTHGNSGFVVVEEDGKNVMKRQNVALAEYMRSQRDHGAYLAEHGGMYMTPGSDQPVTLLQQQTVKDKLPRHLRESKTSKWIHGLLDAGGTIPVLGIVPDALNAMYYGIQGLTKFDPSTIFNKEKRQIALETGTLGGAKFQELMGYAAMSSIAAIPLVGQFGTGAKYTMKGGKKILDTSKMLNKNNKQLKLFKSKREDLIKNPTQNKKLIEELDGKITSLEGTIKEINTLHYSGKTITKAEYDLMVTNSKVKPGEQMKLFDDGMGSTSKTSKVETPSSPVVTVGDDAASTAANTKKGPLSWMTNMFKKGKNKVTPNKSTVKKYGKKGAKYIMWTGILTAAGIAVDKFIADPIFRKREIERLKNEGFGIDEDELEEIFGSEIPSHKEMLEQTEETNEVQTPIENQPSNMKTQPNYLDSMYRENPELLFHLLLEQSGQGDLVTPNTPSNLKMGGPIQYQSTGTIDRYDPSKWSIFEDVMGGLGYEFLGQQQDPGTPGVLTQQPQVGQTSTYGEDYWSTPEGMEAFYNANSGVLGQMGITNAEGFDPSNPDHTGLFQNQYNQSLSALWADHGDQFASAGLTQEDLMNFGFDGTYKETTEDGVVTGRTYTPADASLVNQLDANFGGYTGGSQGWRMSQPTEEPIIFDELDIEPENEEDPCPCDPRLHVDDTDCCQNEEELTTDIKYNKPRNLSWMLPVLGGLAQFPAVIKGLQDKPNLISPMVRSGIKLDRLDYNNQIIGNRRDMNTVNRHIQNSALGPAKIALMMANQTKARENEAKIHAEGRNINQQIQNTETGANLKIGETNAQAIARANELNQKEMRTVFENKVAAWDAFGDRMSTVTTDAMKFITDNRIAKAIEGETGVMGADRFFNANPQFVVDGQITDEGQQAYMIEQERKRNRWNWLLGDRSQQYRGNVPS